MATKRSTEMLEQADWCDQQAADDGTFAWNLRASARMLRDGADAVERQSLQFTNTIETKLADALKEIDRLTSALHKWENREGAHCPEDKGFEQVIEHLNKQLAALGAENQNNLAELRKAWPYAGRCVLRAEAAEAKVARLKEQHALIVKAYDSMSRLRWDNFTAYCDTNNRPNSTLLSFVEYLLACAEQVECRPHAHG